MGREWRESMQRGRKEAKPKERNRIGHVGLGDRNHPPTDEWHFARITSLGLDHTQWKRITLTFPVMYIQPSQSLFSYNFHSC